LRCSFANWQTCKFSSRKLNSYRRKTENIEFSTISLITKKFKFYYRPTATAGVNFRQIAWGASGDKPTVGDYDADGKLEAAVFRPSNGIWFVSRSSDNQLQSVQFGLITDRLVPADYDGDGKTDIAVFRNAVWYLQQSQLGFAGVQFGSEMDVPAPADYDGDGKTDIAVFRNGMWYLQRSQAGFAGVGFGASNDLPIPNAFVR